MAKFAGISGTAVGLATAGGFLLYAGLRGVPLQEGLRQILSGQVPTGTSKPVEPLKGVGVTGAAVSDGSNSSIASAALKYVGVPYKIGGASPSGFDCSGLVQYVLRHDLGYNVPASVRRVRDFVRWSGVTKIDKSQVQPGDLVAWDFVHMGIATQVSGDTIMMVHAPNVGQKVKVQKVWANPPPTHYLRVLQASRTESINPGAVLGG